MFCFPRHSNLHPIFQNTAKIKQLNKTANAGRNRLEITIASPFRLTSQCKPCSMLCVQSRLLETLWILNLRCHLLILLRVLFVSHPGFVESLLLTTLLRVGHRAPNCLRSPQLPPITAFHSKGPPFPSETCLGGWEGEKDKGNWYEKEVRCGVGGKRGEKT